MKDHDRTYTSLSKHVQSGIGPDDEARTCRLRVEAYRQQRIAIIHLDKIHNDWDRRHVENIVKQQLGIA